MHKPLCVELFCGTFGWSAGWLALGGMAVGFDIEHHPWHGPVPDNAHLVLQDVRTLHGSQLKNASLILASSPCTKYSYMAMPWTKARDMAKWYRDPAHPERLVELNELFEQPRRIQREACEAAGRYIPMVQENVKGAQPWVGRAPWHYGSYYLWGDVPALMPITHRGVKLGGGYSWYPPGDPRHQPGIDFTRLAGRETKNEGGSWFNVAHNVTSGHGRNPDGRPLSEGAKGSGSWFGGTYAERKARWPDSQIATPSKGNTRKAAAARIARIPGALSDWIAQCYFPRAEAVA